MGRASLHRDLVNINLVKGTRISLPQVEHAAEDSEQGEEVGGLAAEHRPLWATALATAFRSCRAGQAGGWCPRVAG